MMGERAAGTAANRPAQRLAAAGLCIGTLLAGCQAGERPTSGNALRVGSAPPAMSALPAGGAASGGHTRVTGLDGRAVARLLGEPGLIRREAPAEVWQYRTTDCVLDLFLYEETTGTRVVYAEARTAAAEPVPAEPCLNRLLAMRQRLPGN